MISKRFESKRSCGHGVAEATSRHLAAGTEQKQSHPAGFSVSRSRFESDTSQIQSQSVTSTPTRYISTALIRSVLIIRQAGSTPPFLHLHLCPLSFLPVFCCLGRYQFMANWLYKYIPKKLSTDQCFPPYVSNELNTWVYSTIEIKLLAAAFFDKIRPK
jgi:hypothetical protein